MATAAQSSPMADRVKLAAALLIFTGALGYSVYLGATSGPLLRLGVVLIGLLAGAAVGWTSEPGKRFHAYCLDAITETKKVVWPSRKETIQSTGVVILFVIVMAIFLWIVDTSLMVVVRFLFGREG